MTDFHLHFTFQALVIAAIFLVLWQIKVADCLDGMRYSSKDWWFRIRRGSMFIKLGALCWGVVYGYSNHWTPWPPVILFIAAFDVCVLAQVKIMKRDLVRLERLASMSGRGRVGERG